MSWIEIISPSQSDGELARIYDRCVDGSTEDVDHILQIHSLHPAGLEAHLALYQAVMRGTPTLRKVERELIALLVSQLNQCHY